MLDVSVTAAAGSMSVVWNLRVGAKNNPSDRQPRLNDLAKACRHAAHSMLIEPAAKRAFTGRMSHYFHCLSLW